MDITGQRLYKLQAVLFGRGLRGKISKKANQNLLKSLLIAGFIAGNIPVISTANAACETGSYSVASKATIECVTGTTGTDQVILNLDSVITGSVNLGEGDDEVILNQNSVITGDVNLGNGDDSFAMQGNDGRLEGNLYLGNGNDIINIAPDGVNIIEGTIDTGAGDDTVNIEGFQDHGPQGQILTGTGNDFVTLEWVEAPMGLDLGAGDDILLLTGKSTNNFWGFTYKQEAIIGGDGYDILRIDGNEKINEDIIGFETLDILEGSNVEMVSQSASSFTNYTIDGSLIVGEQPSGNNITENDYTSLDLQAGQTLSGTGTLTGGLNNIAGTVQVGIGDDGFGDRFEIRDGDFIQGENGTLLLDIGDESNVNGTLYIFRGNAEINGTLLVNYESGLATGETRDYLLVFTSTGYAIEAVPEVVTGFGVLIKDELSISDDQTQFSLHIERQPIREAIFVGAGASPSADLVDQLTSPEIDDFGNYIEGTTVLQELDVALSTASEAELQGFLKSQSGAAALAGSKSANLVMALNSNVALDRLDSPTPSIGIATGDEVQTKDWTAWVRANRGSGTLDDGVAELGYKYDMKGMTYGVHAHNLVKDGRIGLFAGFTKTETLIDNAGVNSPDTSNSSTFQFGLYGNYKPHNDFDIMLALSSASIDMETVRSTLTGTALGDTNGKAYQAMGELTYFSPYETHGLDIRPVFGFQYSESNVNAYSETGAGDSNLAVAPDKVTNLKISAGSKYVGEFDLGDSDLTLGVNTKFVIAQELMDHKSTSTLYFLNDPAQQIYYSESAERERTSLQAKIRFNIGEGDLNYGGVLYVGYDAEVSLNTEDQNLTAGFKYRW